MSGMTRKEAIEILSLARFTGSSASELDAISEALDVAIEALKERPHGEWVRQYKNDGRWHDMGYFDHMYKCSKCGSDGSQRWHFCPNCGALMKEGESE